MTRSVALMETIDPSAPLGDLVTAQPGLAPVLEALELDYCCGGASTLAEACFANGLVVQDVVEELRAHPESEPEEWTSMTAAELVDHLERTHHPYLSGALVRLTVLMDRVVDAHGTRHRELSQVSSVLADLRAELEPHLMKEEQILFPMIRQLCASDVTPTFHCGSLQNPITVMRTEHDGAGDLLAQLRSLTSDYAVPSDGCASYQALYAGLAELEADTHLHIHKENNVLFPAVVEEERRRAMS
jgi:regulator of cell morphogenesis and NO signaling